MDNDTALRALRGLDEDGIDIQCASIEATHELFVETIERILTLFESTDHPYLVAERLSRFGSIIVEPLERLLERISDNERCVLASVVLLSLGSQKGVELVIRELVEGGEYEGLAASALMKSGNPATADALISRLRRFSSDEFADMKNSGLIGVYLHKLRMLGFGLPDDIRSRISSTKGTEAYRYYIE